MVKELHECAVLAPDASHGIPLVNARPKMNNPFGVGYKNNQRKSRGGDEKNGRRRGGGGGGGAEAKAFHVHFHPSVGLFFLYVKIG